MSESQKKGLAVGVTVIVGIILAYSLYANLGGERIPANTRQLKCSETNELFPLEMKPGLGHYPHVNPETGRRTLYPVEWCYNGECLAKGGTPVILNTQLGKEEPTYCPVCGHIVRFHNPGPARD
ncbi:MAG: hypothetical protein JSV19_05930 [Phycisphaerales bacterium]|nr:MAG: hypothetical protein JSV19_05930 [Phycisphaerales bacterium]